MPEKTRNFRIIFLEAILMRRVRKRYCWAIVQSGLKQKNVVEETVVELYLKEESFRRTDIIGRGKVTLSRTKSY